METARRRTAPRRSCGCGRLRTSHAKRAREGSRRQSRRGSCRRRPCQRRGGAPLQPALRLRRRAGRGWRSAGSAPSGSRQSRRRSARSSPAAPAPLRTCAWNPPWRSPSSYRPSGGTAPRSTPTWRWACAPSWPNAPRPPTRAGPGPSIAGVGDDRRSCQPPELTLGEGAPYAPALPPEARETWIQSTLVLLSRVPLSTDRDGAQGAVGATPKSSFQVTGLDAPYFVVCRAMARTISQAPLSQS